MKEDPIQNLDTLDIVGDRNDGGADVVIIASSYLNNSEHHTNLLTQKLQCYINTILSDEWEEKYGRGNTDIIVKATEKPHTEIIELIMKVKAAFSEHNVGLVLEYA